jgi:hypothetical protein
VFLANAAIAWYLARIALREGREAFEAR